ncbi:MAG: hypothetical protein IT559_07870 [Alphaproteobacteria bacterium]|nr:hypothetical protein [Alphaproteobacteria bacterium]
MKKIIAYMLVLAVLIGFYAGGAVRGYAAEPVVFFSALQDVPLMPGLREINEQTVIFDKPDGRIVESFAEIEDGSQEAVLRYYSASLPPFGWTKRHDGRFLRDKEILELRFQQLGDDVFLRISVMPIHAGR